jgi:hypothetical protein
VLCSLDHHCGNTFASFNIPLLKHIVRINCDHYCFLLDEKHSNQLRSASNQHPIAFPLMPHNYLIIILQQGLCLRLLELYILIDLHSKYLNLFHPDHYYRFLSTENASRRVYRRRKRKVCELLYAFEFVGIPQAYVPVARYRYELVARVHKT